ncbi:14-3-3-like protein [Teleopsis dalmanni]|uniref:14-3-3-like protein n=1 Tax=Teleopsis dalmanni TaxID=139649 RepID=UPI0018CFD067|nr:14-3-3-like protein [Teleopsis dalmanni]
MASDLLKLRATIVARIKVAELIQDFDEMAAVVKELVELDPNLNNEELYWLSVAYKKCVNARRNSCITVNNALIKEQEAGNMKNVDKAQSLLEVIQNEIRNYCEEILDLLETKLLLHADTDNAKVVCWKLMGDHNRFLAEIETGETRQLILENANRAYSSGHELATSSLEIAHPLRLAICLNYSIFKYEFLNEYQDAHNMATNAYNEGINGIRTPGDKDGVKRLAVTTFLHDNCSAWIDSKDLEKKKPEETPEDESLDSVAEENS